MARNYFFYKVFTSLLISANVFYLETNSQSQSNCPANIAPSANLTNGVTAMVITAPDGELLGIRVMWRIKSEYLGCQFTTLRVELFNTHSGGLEPEIGKNISTSTRTADFVNEQFDCNSPYTPRIRAVHHDSFGIVTIIEDNGIPVLYRGKIGSPSKLSRVCVGPPTSLVDQTQGKVNISWDPLPCHLQNGADVSYVIWYTNLLTGQLANFSRSNHNVECHQEPGGPCSCLISSSALFTHGVAYSFQVAAQSVYGEGSFSDPVITNALGSQDTYCTIRSFESVSIADTDVPDPASTTVTVTKESDTTVSNSSAINKVTDLLNECVHSTCEDHTGWTMMRSLIAAIAVLSGVVMPILLIVVCVLWKRLKFNKTEKTQTLMIMNHDKSTNADKIDMKECSAYGQMISPQPVTEQPHIYETIT